MSSECWDMFVAIANEKKASFLKEKSQELSRNEAESSERLIKRPEEDVEEEQVMRRKRRKDGKRPIIQESDDSEQVDASRPKKKIRSTKKNQIELPNPVPDLPDDIKKKITDMGGTNVTLVIVKPLTESDRSKGQSRLSMPASKVVDDFLEEHEKNILHSGRKISVELISQGREKTPIPLKIWVMPKENGRESRIYVLTSPWLDVVKDNEFKKDDIIQVRSFRVEGRLGLAIARIDRPVSEE